MRFIVSYVPLQAIRRLNRCWNVSQKGAWNTCRARLKNWEWMP